MAFITPELARKMATLTSDFETAIRADERKRLLARFRAEFPATGNQTDMHGNSLEPVRATRKLAPSLEALRAVLACRPYPVTIMTLCRELNCAPTAAHQRLKELRRAGYRVDTIRTGGRLAKYRLAC